MKEDTCVSLNDAIISNVKSMVNEYDKIIFQQLERYGITKDNIYQFKYKLLKCNYINNPNEEQFFFEGKHIFTIIKHYRFEQSGYTHEVGVTYQIVNA